MCKALRTTCRQRTLPPGLILQSNQGSQYVSWPYCALGTSSGTTVSMSRRANDWDNIPTVSFFKTLKIERTYQTRDETRAQARLGVVDWREGYDDWHRLHSSTGSRTPVQTGKTLMAT